MANVYTTLLYENNSTLSGANLTTAVPAGHVWVVTDIVMWAPGGLYTNAGAAAIRDSLGCLIFQAPRQVSTGNTEYRWQGRQVLTAADYMDVFTVIAGWEVRITGFVLTLP